MIRAVAMLAMRAAIRCLPARERERFGAEMLALFGRRCTDARRRGLAAQIRLSARAWVDVLRTAVALRFEARRPPLHGRHDGRGSGGLDGWLQDVRYALRGMRKSPGFTLAAVTILALGIGANAAVFSLMDVLLFRAPARVAQPDRVVALYTSEGDGPGVSVHLDFRDLAERVEAFADSAAYKTLQMDLSVSGADTERVGGTIVTGGYFSTLGLRPALGRLLEPRDDLSPNAHPVAVLSWSSWQRRFAGDPSTVGSEVLLNGRAFTIVGVAPEGFTGTALETAPPELYAPMMMQPHFMPSAGNLLDRRGWGGVYVLARLRDDTTLDAARAQLAAAGEWIRTTYPRNAGERTYEIVPVAQAAVPPAFRGDVSQLGLLLAAVTGLVLLVACVNLANLLLARSAVRRREIAVRQALGAGRARVARQMLVETSTLALFGGALGLWLAHLLVGTFDLLPISLPGDVALDVRVAAFTLALSLASGLAFGVLPAIRATRTDLVHRLRETGDLRRRRRGRPAAKVLVAAQVALSTLLMVVAGLLARTLIELESVDLGFRPEGVAVLTVDPSLQGYEADATAELYGSLLTRGRALPEVTAMSLTSSLPGPGDSDFFGLWVEGQPADDRVRVGFGIVATDYFRALGIPVPRGRAFEASDASSGALVGMVNPAAAALLRERYGRDALGLSVGSEGPEGPVAQIIGVTADSTTGSPRASASPMFYLMHEQVVRQGWGARMTLVARTSGDPALLAGRLRDLLADQAPGVPAFAVGTLSEHVAGALDQDRAVAILTGVAGLSAVALALVGLYGVLSYAVSRRASELGVRMALGARASDLSRLVIREGVAVAAAGVFAGGLLALLGSRLLGSFLYGVSASDPATYAGVVGLLLLVAAVAAWIPARRATRVDPASALRSD